METHLARLSPSSGDLNQRRVTYLSGRMIFWGQTLKKDGLSDIAASATRIGMLLKELLEEDYTESIWADISEERRRLRGLMSFSRAISALGRIVEDLDDEILKPRRLLASSARVASRYAARSKWEVEVMVRNKRTRKVDTKLTTVSADSEETAKAIAGAKYRSQGNLHDVGFARPKKASDSLFEVIGAAARHIWGRSGWSVYNMRDTYAITLQGAPEYRGANFTDIDHLLKIANEGDVEDFLHALKAGLRRWGRAHSEEIDSGDYQPKKVGISFMDDSNQRQAWAIDLGSAFKKLGIRQAATTIEIGKKTGIEYDARKKQFTAEMSMLRGGFPATLVNPSTGGKMTFRNPEATRDREYEVQYWTLYGPQAHTLRVYND
jgi:hypothetical protein